MCPGDASIGGRNCHDLSQRQGASLCRAVGEGGRGIASIAAGGARCSEGRRTIRGDCIEMGRLDILVHSIAFAPREALAGRVTDCPRDGFLTAMDVSCWSFLDLTRRAEKLMSSGGTILTMSYHGASEVIENYGIMGPVKAALEAAL